MRVFKQVFGRELRIQKSITRGARDRHYANEWKPGGADDVRVAHDDARSRAALFVSDRRIEFDDDHGAATKPHARSSTQPSPGTHRTGLPALLSTNASPPHYRWSCHLAVGAICLTIDFQRAVSRVLTDRLTQGAHSIGI